MTATHEQGPALIYGYNPPTGTGTAGDYNPDAGPSCGYQGDCILDPRYPYGGGGNALGSTAAGAILPGVQWAGFFNSPYIQMVDAVPSTIATANISALAAPASGVAQTLVSTTGAGITVSTCGAVAAGYVMMGSAPGIRAQTSTTALLAIDSIYAPLTVGCQAIHDPTKAICRAVSLTSLSNLSAIVFTVRGFDLYGYKMQENITGPNNNTVNGKKAFKYILSVTPNGSNAGTVSVGTSDIFGLNIRNIRWEYDNIFWNGAFVSVSTGWLTADVTSPATATTGDVRGTYALQSASDNAKRLAMFISIPVADMTSATPTNFVTMFGVTQFATF